jgi:hypothetical protein
MHLREGGRLSTIFNGTHIHQSRIMNIAPSEETLRNEANDGKKEFGMLRGRCSGSVEEMAAQLDQSTSQHGSVVVTRSVCIPRTTKAIWTGAEKVLPFSPYTL